MPRTTASGDKLIAENRQARHKYEILEHFEAGIALLGSEVKSLRLGQAQLKDSYALIRNGEAYLLNCHIAPYQFAGYATAEAERTRKLLLHKAEIARLSGKTREKGLTLVPLRLYFHSGCVKCELALVRGKQLFDKRETERRREADREARAALKRHARR